MSKLNWDVSSSLGSSSEFCGAKIVRRIQGNACEDLDVHLTLRNNMGLENRSKNPAFDPVIEFQRDLDIGLTGSIISATSELAHWHERWLQGQC